MARRYTPEELERLRQVVEDYERSLDTLTDTQKLAYQIARDQLATQEELLRNLDDQIARQKTRVEQLQLGLNLESDYSAKVMRRKVLNEELLKQQRLLAAQLREKLITEGDIDEELKKQLENTEKRIEAQELVNEATEKNQKLIDDISGTMEDKLIKATAQFADMMGRPMSDKLTAINNKMNSFVEAGFGKLIAEAKKLVFQFDHLTKSFERQFQLGPQYTESIENQYHAMAGLGVSIEDAVEAQSQLATSFTDFTMLSQSQRDAISENSLVLNELGVAQADFAKGMQNSTKFFGQTADQAMVIQREIVATARELGREPGALAAEFAAAGGSLAKFGEDGVKAFKDLSRISKITGMEMDKVLSITNRFDTFEGAAEMAGQLNAALGGNFVNAMDMMMETDPAARFEQVRDAITGAGLSFDDMSYYQKQFYTEALGLSDVGDLAMMLSGNMDDLAGATNKSAEQLVAEKEKAKEVQSAQEELTIAMNEVMKSFTKFAPLLQNVVGLVGALADKAHIIIPLMAGYKTIMLGLAFAKGVATMATAGLIKAETAQALTGKKAAVTLGIVALSIAAITAALMIASPSKLVLAMFGFAAALFAVGKVAEKSAVGLGILATTLPAVGVGVFLVAAGISIMAMAFSLLSVGQMLGMAAALGVMAAAFYFISPALIAFAGSAIFAVGPLLALSAVIISIGAASVLMGIGVKLAAEGMAVMFEAIDPVKMLSFSLFIWSLVAAAPFMMFTAINMGFLVAAMLALSLALWAIPTSKMKEMALFTYSLAQLNITNVLALTKALRGVAEAMDDIPTVKAIALTATLSAAETAARAAANMLAGRAPPATTTVAQTGTNAAAGPINVHVTLELDGEVLDSRIVKTTTNAQSSGGALDVVANILN